MQRMFVFDHLGHWITRRLQSESSGYQPYTPSDPEVLRKVLRPGDVLLIEGNQKISVGIKYLTQSTWSHAALFVGDAAPAVDAATREEFGLIEVLVADGCIAVPLSKYETFNTRICRPMGLSDDERAQVVDYMIGKIGTRYDLKNIIDLARFLFPTPPVPVRWRRRMIALGSGEPTRAICSSLIAQAFQSVRYPILPSVEDEAGHRPFVPSPYSRDEILHIRHHSLFTPRDFDLSPFFEVIKPTLESGFDHRRLKWSHHGPQVGDAAE